jgi:hypothetical protein
VDTVLFWLIDLKGVILSCSGVVACIENHPVPAKHRSLKGVTTYNLYGKARGYCAKTLFSTK